MKQKSALSSAFLAHNDRYGLSAYLRWDLETNFKKATTHYLEHYIK